MQRYAGQLTKRLTRKVKQSRTRDRSHPRDNRPKSGTYLDGVPAPDVNRARFARFVARVLADAHDRGLTDRDIEAATGVGSSTFHRWQTARFARSPSIEKVRAFCAGLGVNPRAALLALGLDEGRDSPEPEPAIEPDVRTVLRALADPNTSESDKTVIRAMLRMLAQRVRSTPTSTPTGDPPIIQS